MIDFARAKEILVRGLLLRCPDCGRTRLYESLFKMRKHCASCGLIFEREQGYFVGALYVNVIVTESLLLFSFIIYYAFRPFSEEVLYPLLFILALVLPLVFFHHSRSLWLSFDHIIEPNEKRLEPRDECRLE